MEGSTPPAAQVWTQDDRRTYKVEVIVFDGAGKRFGGTAEVEPNKLEEVLMEMAKTTILLAEGSHDVYAEQRERLGFIQVKRPMKLGGS